MRLKSQEVKGKLFDYIVNPSASATNSIENKNGKSDEENSRGKNPPPVFSIDDDQDLGKISTEFSLFWNEVKTFKKNINRCRLERNFLLCCNSMDLDDNLLNN